MLVWVLSDCLAGNTCLPAGRYDSTGKEGFFIAGNFTGQRFNLHYDLRGENGKDALAVDGHGVRQDVLQKNVFATC